MVLTNFNKALDRYKKENYHLFWRYQNGRLPRILQWLVERPELAAALAADAAQLATGQAVEPQAAAEPQAVAADAPAGAPALSALEVFQLGQLGWEWSGASQHAMGEWIFELVKVNRRPREVQLQLGVIWKTHEGITNLIKGDTSNGTDTDRSGGAEGATAVGSGAAANGAENGRPVGAGAGRKATGARQGRKERAG